VEVQRDAAKATELLVNFRAGWMLYGARHPSPQPDFSDFPLKDVWETWWKTRPEDLHDEDGFELIRALAAASLLNPSWSMYLRPSQSVPKEFQSYLGIHLNFEPKYGNLVHAILEWLVWAHPVAGETDFILNALEESIGKIPRSELVGLQEQYDGVKTRALPHQRLTYLNIARWHRVVRSASWTDQHHARLWKVVCWLNEPEAGLTGHYAMLDDALFAYQAGAATRDDLYYMFIGNREVGGHRAYYGVRFEFLYQFSGRKMHAQLESQFDKFPIIGEIVDECRERILDVECRRGDLPTAATLPAVSIRSVPGMRDLFRLLLALGDADFERGYLYGQSRSGTFSHLIRNSYPIETDMIEGFVQQARLHSIPEKRLIELAVYAPQWATYVQAAVGWDHLTDAIWWLYAHTKDRQWTVEVVLREEWAARISEHTPLTADDLLDGAVDVAWFGRVYRDLGEERWSRLYEAAVYTSSGYGHGRARLFADAMLGRVSVEAESEHIKKKRHQDSVRALGLIPLDHGKDTKSEVLRRYEVMQEFLRTGKKFGSQRKASEKLAVLIGMQNLARTAGYADPQRLEWAMEVEAVADLAEGPIQADVDDFQIRLSINDLGEPELQFFKKDKPVKTLPSAIKKNERVAELLERTQQLDRQVSRMRLSLENAMCRGDEFTMSEIKELLRHPMLRVMLEQLVLVSQRGLGYPVHTRTRLIDYSGADISLADEDGVRIAHPLDLLESKNWHLWQHECFVSERIQPFKQIFRELYVLTVAEKEEGYLSRRYAGQQVNPRQAMALFGGRSWVVDPHEGVQRTFHTEGICARVGFLQGMLTPAEVEGLTIDAILFTKRGEWKGLSLDQIPPRIFSEVMRDLDLVVSVAHAGGVDPESSASSIAARLALVRETSSLLNLNNVQLSERHVIIDGKLANYNVNLGSGVVHKQPGGAICIIPVHSQYRGRIFLPFVDNDPKTAEIVSKVVLLARDDQIKDPTILEQLL
jgi:hypothetical protein